MRPQYQFQALLRALTLVASCQGVVVVPRDASSELGAVNALDLVQRALPGVLDNPSALCGTSLTVVRTADAPGNSYTPEYVDCPSDRPTVRSASSLSQGETSWLDKRRNNTVNPMRTLLSRINIAGFDAGAYIDKNSKNQSAFPNIGIAVSGGGYRALMNGGGALAAFDDRTVNATGNGQLGGLLQSATYLAGLSGGGWLVGSIFVNNFTSVQALQSQTSGSVWEFGNSIFEGPKKSGLQILDSVSYYNNINDAVSKKSEAGFNTSITDYWGRALSFQLINATNGGPGYTFSSIADDQTFKDGNSPMPILIADSRAPGEKLISNNATVYEFNPFEFGTFDPTTFGFVPTRYLGSNFSNGVLPDGQRCVRGFDNAGYVMGTSSTLFNQFLLQINDTNGPAKNVPSVVKNAIIKVLENIGQDNNDIADYTPNPFFGYHNSTSRNAQSKTLTLVDGGEDLQNIPLHPLIQPKRNVDVIFAVDSSADTDFNWPNGTALVATYQRSLNKSEGGIENGTAFPSIPDQNTFVNLGLNTHPTFFGCNSSNSTGPTPLIVYIPNTPLVYNSNVSTFTSAYNNSERNAIVMNGYDVATRGNGTQDSATSSSLKTAAEVKDSLDSFSTLLRHRVMITPGKAHNLQRTITLARGAFAERDLAVAEAEKLREAVNQRAQRKKEGGKR
ncbi:MAG: Lysophospholipase 1 [Candelina mexicana]|nr:MAG: Lysophospholipase 1 [Candelina mexicana]